MSNSYKKNCLMVHALITISQTDGEIKNALKFLFTLYKKSSKEERLQYIHLHIISTQ